MTAGIISASPTGSMGACLVDGIQAASPEVGWTALATAGRDTSPLCCRVSWTITVCRCVPPFAGHTRARCTVPACSSGTADLSDQLTRAVGSKPLDRMPEISPCSDHEC